jgi:hypothetical protein
MIASMIAALLELLQLMTDTEAAGILLCGFVVFLMWCVANGRGDRR